MDFDQLHTFLEIVRLKSFSKAAQTCYRTQPAISAQVRQLEQELHAELFERFGSRISLTTAGKIFAGYAEQMLDLRRRAQDDIAELESNPRGELVIAANEATCIYVLPRSFREYRQLFPAVQLQVNRSYGSRVVEAVMDNSADFGMTQLPVRREAHAGGQRPPRRDPRRSMPARPSAGRPDGGRAAGSDGLLPACCRSRGRRARA